MNVPFSLVYFYYYTFNLVMLLWAPSSGNWTLTAVYINMFEY